MRSHTPTWVVLGALLFTLGVFALLKTARIEHRTAQKETLVNASSVGSTTPLLFGDLLEHGATLRPSAKARELNGRRVRVTGFMAVMEEPIRGGFYLVSHPVSLDESGAGTGDLPLESVLVMVPGAEGRVIPHLPGALEGTGILEVGNRSDDDEHVSNFRLRLDPDQRWVDAVARR